MSGILKYFTRLSSSQHGLNIILRRNIGVSACAFNKATATNNMDPVQKLFLDKIKEYQTKAKKTEAGKLVDTSPEQEAKMHKEIDGLRRRFGEGNLEEFPKFDFVKK